MLNALRKKFIVTIMLLVGLLLTVLLGVIGAYTYQNLRSDLQTALVRAVQPWDGGDELPPGGVTLGDEQQEDSYLAILAVNYHKRTGTISRMSQDVFMEDAILEKAVDYVRNSDAASGTIPEYHLVYYKNEGENDVLMSFASSRYVTSTWMGYLVLFVLLEIAALGIVYGISCFVSRLAIASIEKVWQEQKRFIADASHELKTPLTVIMANNSILRAQGDAPVSSQMVWLDSTEAEARHMQTLIHDLLLLAQNESGVQERPFVQLDFSNLVTRAALQFEAVAYERGILFTEHIEPEILLWGDEVQLHQLVMSLLDNAVKYEAVGGAITVGLKRERERVQLEVQNAATVIPAEDLPHLFERFYRSNQERTADGSFGLGLAIVRSIVEHHRGRITVTSNAQEGTCFQVELDSRQKKR